MEKSCIEQFLNDVIRVKLVPASACSFNVPFMVSGITSISGTVGSAELSLAIEQTSADQGEYEPAPVLKQSEKREPAGIIITHELQIAVKSGFSDVRKKVGQLQHKDFHVILITEGGSQYLCYSLPNASGVSIEEQGVEDTANVKVTIESFNHIINLE